MQSDVGVKPQFMRYNLTMPIKSKQLRKIREELNLSREQAANSVFVTPRTWMSWELDESTDNHRNMPEGLLELFCIKNNLQYRVLDNAVHIV